MEGQIVSFDLVALLHPCDKLTTPGIISSVTSPKACHLKVFFCGAKVAQVKRIEDGKDDVLAPFFMDGVAVFEAPVFRTKL